MKEISRLVREQYITAEQEQMIDANVIANFFNTDIGRRVCTSNHVMREFKFSILVDSDMENGNNDDKILIQGVVDCFLIEDDGITVIDFKSDNITDDEIETAVLRYRPQIETYAKALERIYQLPIKSAQLYFFALNTFAGVI